MKKFILEQASNEFYTSHAGLALVGPAINRIAKLNHCVKGAAKARDVISIGDIVRSYLGLLCLGKSDFEAITTMQNDIFFQQALGIRRLPSAETLR